MNKEEYKICRRCVMDTSDLNITFDDAGICNHCKSYKHKIKTRVFRGEDGLQKLNLIVEQIKKENLNKKYDCIVGLSGGADSTYVVHLINEFGLRPLVVHLDNGWNSKTATINISRLLKKIGADLYTYVINWEEFRDLQLSYLKSSVVDIEALTDHAIKAALYKTAKEKKARYIITGTNLLTEGIMGAGWTHNKNDYANILDIHRKFGKIKLKTFPMLKFWERVYYQGVCGIKTIELLNYIDYNKNEVKKLLKEKYGWEDYGRKHGESRFTRFYQEYILPIKFGIDKRRAHLSALICAGQIDRQDALEELKRHLYSKEDLRIEKEYVLKKFGLSEEEFEDIMNLPVKSHYDYKSQDKFLRILGKVYRKFS